MFLEKYPFWALEIVVCTHCDAAIRLAATDRPTNTYTEQLDGRITRYFQWECPCCLFLLTMQKDPNTVTNGMPPSTIPHGTLGDPVDFITKEEIT
jgi:hypothetical protein